MPETHTAIILSRLHSRPTWRRFKLRAQGEWWFRGVLRIESMRRSLTRVTLPVYNVAPSPGRLLVPLMTRGMKEKTELDLRAISQRLAR